MKEEKAQIYHEIEKIADELNSGRKIDWKDLNQEKYYIYYDFDVNTISDYYTYNIRELGQIYCLDPYFGDIVVEKIEYEKLEKFFKED